MTARAARRRALAGEGGFTLAELLVVIVILGMIMAALFGVLDVSQRAYTRAMSSEDAQITARAALDLMAREIALAGSFYTGIVGSALPPPSPFPAAAFWGATTSDAPTASVLSFRGDVDRDAVTTATNTTANSVTVASATNLCPGEWVHISQGSAQEVRQIASVAGTTVTLATSLVGTYDTTGGVVVAVRSVETISYTYDPEAGTLSRTMTHSPWLTVPPDASSCAVPLAADQVLVENVTAFEFKYFDDLGVETSSAGAIREIRISITTAGSAGHRRTMQVRVRPMSLTLT
jgi:prepilin-type N-terminal cleavage/methylation domain-containing protein